MNKRIAGLLLAVTLAFSPLAISGAQANAATTSVTSGSKIVNQGAKYKGVRYKWGGTSPAQGFDCSGLTSYTLKKLGKSIPRVANDQYKRSVHVKTPKAGDLVFVHNVGSTYVYHVGIYVNSHTWLESERPGKGVNYYKPWTKSVYYGRYTVK
ncbi:C40 family peptidase [Streptomyces sp. NPDC006631]|uniref:C40 family peptidase n=1 Tax=Streptomyces sp. NPDC006631 TaxID=3364752 RepID=UPI0036B01FDA